ncbi:reverse transcriptase [Tanacetum coccineum]
MAISFVKGHCLILRPWNPNVHISEIDFAHENFWVQAHGLPFGKLTKAYATEIAPKVGTLVDVDCDVEGYQFDRSYLHFRVTINLRKPLCLGFSLKCDGKEPLYISFKYEKLGDFCYYCGRLGHDEYSCGYDRDETISQVGAGMRALLFKRPIASLRNQQPLHQTQGHPSTPHILNDKVPNDTNNESPSTSPTDPIQITSHKFVSHVASSSSISTSPTHNTWSDTINLSFTQTNPVQYFSTTPIPNYMCQTLIFVPTYFVTEPTDDSPPSSPIQNESLIVKPLAIEEGINIIQENLSKLSVGILDLMRQNE